MTILVAFIIAAIASVVSLLVGVGIGRWIEGSRTEPLFKAVERAVRHLQRAAEIFTRPEVSVAEYVIVHGAIERALHDLSIGEKEVDG